MHAYVDKYVAPVWGTPAKLIKTTDFKKGAWAIVFLDDADQPGTLAYHDLTPDGPHESKVFVKTTLKNGDLVSVSASHELVEMLVDPAINLMTTGPNSKLVYAYESADPVEALSFNVNGIPMSDFVFPAYFEDFHKSGSVQFDAMKKGQHTVSDSQWRLSDRLQEWEVEQPHRIWSQDKGAESRGPPRTPQRTTRPEETEDADAAEIRRS